MKINPSFFYSITIIKIRVYTEKNNEKRYMIGKKKTEIEYRYLYYNYRFIIISLHSMLKTLKVNVFYSKSKYQIE